jgi:hypothetical protein
MMRCQDRDESPESLCWRAADIQLQENCGQFNWGATAEDDARAMQKALEVVAP